MDPPGHVGTHRLEGELSQGAELDDGRGTTVWLRDPRLPQGGPHREDVTDWGGSNGPPRFRQRQGGVAHPAGVVPKGGGKGPKTLLRTSLKTDVRAGATLRPRPPSWGPHPIAHRATSHERQLPLGPRGATGGQEGWQRADGRCLQDEDRGPEDMAGGRGERGEDTGEG